MVQSTLSPSLTPWSLTDHTEMSSACVPYLPQKRERRHTLYYHPCPWASSFSSPLSTNPTLIEDPCYPSIYLDHHHEDGRMRSWQDHGLGDVGPTSAIDLLYRFDESGAPCFKYISSCPDGLMVVKAKEGGRGGWRVKMCGTYFETVPTVATHPGSIRLTSPLCNFTNTLPCAFDLVPSDRTSPPILRISAPPNAFPFGPWWAMIWAFDPADRQSCILPSVLNEILWMVVPAGKRYRGRTFPGLSVIVLNRPRARAEAVLEGLSTV